MTTTRIANNTTSAPRPIKVLIVDTAIAFGGTLVVARNLLKHLDSHLVDASLLSACSDGFVSPGFAGNAKVRLLAPRVNYVTLEKWKVAIGKHIGWAPLRRGVQLMAMVTEILANLPYLVRIVLLYQKLHLDVVHVNNYSMEPVLGARFLGIPVVYHLHGFISPQLDGSGRRSFRRVSSFVSISRGVTESAVRAGIDPARIHEIPNFVERMPDDLPPPLPTVPAIGIFGRIIPWKGQREFLNAALQVLPQFPGLHVYLVGGASDGDPEYFESCRELARSSPYADQIEFTGMVSNVAMYYRKCTVVIHASIMPEPFGMVLIEAMSEARPVVASIFGAASEIIQDGVEGYLVDPMNSHSMAARIATLLADPKLAAEMGLKGLRKVRAIYNPRAAAEEFEQLYRDLAQSKAHLSVKGVRPP
jgi:glycosyltransferase involved in cell wall biosynthesis